MRSLKRLAFPWLLVLAACATPPAAPPAAVPHAAEAAQPAPAAPPVAEVLGRNDEFIVVLPRDGDDLAALAQRHLGDAARAWWIAEFNGIARPSPGVELVVPLRPSLLNSVGEHGVRTLTVLCYHRFDDGRSRLSVSAADFAEQMAYLAENGYTVVALRDLPDILGGRLPMPPKAVAITIDDGYRSTYEVAYPILVRHGFPATVFLYTDFAGLPAAMSWAQMKEMTASGLIDVQPHSKSHSNLSFRQGHESERDYLERLRQEIDIAGAEIERQLGQAIYAYAYPYGDASESVVDRIRRRGISVAFTVSPGGNPVYAYPLMMRRTMIFGGETLADFRRRLAVSLPRGAR